MAGPKPKPSDQELKAASEVLHWLLDQAGPIRITIDMPTGSGRPAVRVDRTSPEQGRPGEGSPGAAEPPISASGDAPFELGESDKTAAAKARQLLLMFGYHHPERALKEFSADRIVEVCKQAHEHQDKIRDIPAWINRALWRHFTF